MQQPPIKLGHSPTCHTRMPLSGIHVLVTGFPIKTFGNDKCPWRPTGLLCAYWCFVSKPVREPFDTSGLRRELSRTINSAKDPMINHEILQSLCSFRMTLCVSSTLAATDVETFELALGIIELNNGL